MPPQTRKQAAQLWKEPPLPGFLDCLTLQVNATYYGDKGLVRWVMVLRDPIGNDEIMRMIGMTRPDDQDGVDALYEDLGSMLTLVDYQLHGDVTDLKQALQEDPPPPPDPPKRTRKARTPIAKT